MFYMAHLFTQTQTYRLCCL